MPFYFCPNNRNAHKIDKCWTPHSELNYVGSMVRIQINFIESIFNFNRMSSTPDVILLSKTFSYYQFLIFPFSGVFFCFNIIDINNWLRLTIQNIMKEKWNIEISNWYVNLSQKSLSSRDIILFYTLIMWKSHSVY